MIDNVRTGLNIAAHRQKLGWTQSELANRLSVTHQAVSKWENGAAFPDISTIYQLSQLFGVTMETLLTGDTAAIHAEHSITPEDDAAPAETITPATDSVQEMQCDTPEDSEEAPPSKSAESTNSSAPADSIDWDQIISLAPFASHDTLDRLISLCEDSCNFDRILSLAPFLSRNTLDRLIQSALTSADWDQIISLAPFASRDTLDRLISLCEDSCDFDHILSLAPFLSRNTLDRLIQSGFNQPLQSNESHRQRKNQPTERAARQAERLAERAARQAEKTAERAMRRAERQSEEIAERAARQYERQFEKAFCADKMAQTISEQVSMAINAAQMAQTISDQMSALRSFTPHLEQPIEKPNAQAMSDAADSARRTEIQDISPDAETLIEYANETLSLLYAACDSEDLAADQFEEIHCALLNQDYAALNQFAPLLDRCIGPQWLEEYAALCSVSGEITDDFESQLNLALTQRNWSWIEDHLHQISDRDMIRRIAFTSSSEGFFDLIYPLLDQLDQDTIDYAAQQAVRLNCTDDILPFAGRVSPGIL